MKEWKNFKKRNAKWNTARVFRGIRSVQDTSNVYSQPSGLEDVVFNDFIKDDFIPVGDGQDESGSTSLPDPVVWETEEYKVEREQNEREVLDTLVKYKCDTGMSVE